MFEDNKTTRVEHFRSGTKVIFKDSDDKLKPGVVRRTGRRFIFVDVEGIEFPVATLPEDLIVAPLQATA